MLTILLHNFLTMQNADFLLYGANGYTGRLIAELAQSYGLKPLLAGRNQATIRAMGEELALPWRCFPLEDKDALQQALREVKLVIHAAGPFADTAAAMLEACLATGRHYLDINGDISVFEFVKKFNAPALQANIMLMPGAGFDVVPTDCMAGYLQSQLPTASRLQLAFASLGGGISHGTAITMASRLGEGGAIRKNGKIVKSPLGKLGMWVDFGLKKRFVMSIPWGDISTAYHTTGIPDIETYTGIQPGIYRLLKLQFLFNWLLRTSFVRNFIRKKIKARPAGPAREQREKAIGLVWGRVFDPSGQSCESRFSGPEGYTLTAHSSLLIAARVLKGDWKPGFQTPAGCYGRELVKEVPGVKWDV